MSMVKYLIEVIDILEDPKIDGYRVKDFLEAKYSNYLRVDVETIKGNDGSVDLVTILIPGAQGKKLGGTAPTLGITGRAGGISARPTIKGLVSDADGVITALAVAYKIAEMARRGDALPGDVIITTNICPNAIVIPHEPAPLIRSPINLFEILRREVKPEMDAILSVDATKANLVVKNLGFAITPTVKEGWILKVSPDLIKIYMNVTGRTPIIVPLTMQDIIPFTVPVYHINSIVQPWLFTKSPVVGVAITTETVIPGSATNVTNLISLDQASRFILEVAYEFTTGKMKFYDENEWNILKNTYGELSEIMRRGLGDSS
ncbi:DUF1177 domain-containing protein [Caldivirga maquilingensis]|nr:DUF1177 domain-containing protein [Caldivirga maquilingensis]